MNSYALYDFTESLERVNLEKDKVAEALFAWGRNEEGYGQWEGGFIVKLVDGRYARIEGWCDTSGWGCQDGATIKFYKSLDDIKVPIVWPYSGKQIVPDPEPVDLNKWLKDPNSKGPYD